MRAGRLIASAIGILLLSSDLSAQTSTSGSSQNAAGSAARAASVSSLQALRLDASSIALDGKIDEAAWLAAPVARDQFTQAWPNPGQPPTEATEVRVLYSADALYVAVRMFDSHPDSIVAALTRRDGFIQSDWVRVVIDSYHDKRTAFEFDVNPRGVQRDMYHSNDNNSDTNWDAVWDAATRIDSLGWTAEFRIPLSQLRFGTKAPGQPRTMGFQVQRDIARKNERATYSPWTPDGTGFVSRFGELTGLVDLGQPQRLEVLPYVSTKVTSAAGNAANPFYKKYDTEPNMGADVRYGLPGGLTLTATINPDFGQVEVDPATVNLSAFETFFPEKRPFFLEGSDVFSFGRLRLHNDYGGQTFFYTRRIGRSPSRFPGGTGINYVDMPEATSIAGAAKISGRLGPWTVGILNAVTAEEEADVASTSVGADSSTVVEPMANFFTGRLRRDFRRGQSNLGGMVTAVSRQQSDLFRNSLSAGAGFGGVDFDHRWQRGKYSVSGFALGSRVNGSPTVIANVQRSPAHYFQRPDAKVQRLDPAASSLTGHYVELAASKSGNAFGSIAIKEVSPGFEINDVGFHGRVDYRAISPFWGFQSNKKEKYTQNWFAGTWANQVWNFDGDVIFQGVGGSTSATFNNLWGANIGGNIQPSVYDDRLLRGGPVARRPSQYSVNASFWSDNRKPIMVNPYGFMARVDDGGWNSNVGIWTEWRPGTNVRVNFNPSLSRQHSKSQFVRTQADADPSAAPTYGARYIFANLDQTTVVFDTRVELTFTSKLSLQSYVQPFVAIGEYQGFKEFTTPRAYEFATYGVDRGTITPGANAQGQPNYTVDPDGAGTAAAFSFRNPNFNNHSLRGNAVLRWEYRPGSALFFVWQQQRSGNEADFAFDAGRDVGGIFRDAPTNVFMIKAAYWLNK